MADKKLKALVTVHDEQGVAHLFGPNDTLPGWAREKITNPNVWEGDDAAEAPVQTPEAPKAPKAPKGPKAARAAGGDKAAPAPEPLTSDDKGDGDEGDGDVDGVITDGAPPRSGKGSSLANWKTWADEQGVQYPADVKQADLIALVDAAASSKE